MGNLGNKEIMAKNIVRYMNDANVSRNDLCNAIGVKYTTLCDWINAKTYPRIDKIELMANFFGVMKSDLVEEEKPATSEDDGLSDAEAAMLKSFRKIPPESQKLVLEMIEAALKSQGLL